MPKLPALSGDIVLFEWRRLRLHLNASDYFHAVALKAEDFARIVRDDAHFFYAQVRKNLRADAVVAFVDGQAERQICLDGIRALILQLVRAQFVGKTDTAPFLPQIQKYAAAGARNNPHRAVPLGGTIAPDGMQRIAGQTLGVHAHHQILAVADIAHDERDVRIVVDRIFKRVTGPGADL